MEKACSVRDIHLSKSKKGNAVDQKKREKTLKAKRGKRKALKEKLSGKEAIPRKSVALHGSGLSVLDSGITNKNKIILEKAIKTSRHYGWA